MKRKLIYTIIFLFLLITGPSMTAQNVGINATGIQANSSAMLDIASSDKGLLIPRMDSTSRKNIVNPAVGLMVFDSTYNSFYFYNGTAWNTVSSDDLGNHKATQNIQLNGNWLNNDGGADKGIYVDVDGKVGIGTQPSAKFHVDMGQRIEANISQTQFNSDLYSNTICQSFTPTKTGTLFNIQFSLVLAGSAVSYNLYEGSGTGGNKIAGPLTQANPAAPFPFSGVTVNASQTYTIEIINLGLNYFRLATNNPYPGGEMCGNSSADLYFIMNLSFPNAGIQIEDNKIQMNEYTLPITDGSAGQILQTDGSGTMDWVSPSVNTDAQQLSLVNDTIYLSNGGFAHIAYFRQFLYLYNNVLSLAEGGGSVNLSGYLDNTDQQQLSISNDTLYLENGGFVLLDEYRDGDNLGNHTATQDLIMGSNWMRQNAMDTVGIHFGANGIVRLEANSVRPLSIKGHTNSLLDGSYIEVNNNAGTRALFGADGNGYTGGDSSDVVLANWSNGALKLFTNATKRIEISPTGEVGIGRTAATNRFEVEGTASKTSAGDWLANSDARLKKNISPLSPQEMLDRMLSLQGVTYEWNDDKTGAKRPGGIQYGFTAQNIREAFPTLVSEDNTGYLQTAYGTYDAMTVEAIRALNNKIRELESRNAALESQNLQMQLKLDELEILKSSVMELKALLEK